MLPILVVPGLGGSEPDHWQSHLERALPGTIRVEQDDWDRPRLADWLPRLAQAVAARPGAVLVAHSLGCPLVVQLAARRPNLRIAAAVLVAPADVDALRNAPYRMRSFAPIPHKPLSFRSVVVASSNDPFISQTRARGLAGAWGADFVDAGAVGHINVASGFGRWQAGEHMVESLAYEVAASGAAA
jgi:uncharacterized protein